LHLGPTEKELFNPTIMIPPSFFFLKSRLICIKDTDIKYQIKWHRQTNNARPFLTTFFQVIFITILSGLECEDSSLQVHGGLVHQI